MKKKVIKCPPGKAYGYGDSPSTYKTRRERGGLIGTKQEIEIVLTLLRRKKK